MKKLMGLLKMKIKENPFEEFEMGLSDFDLYVFLSQEKLKLFERERERF